MTFRAFLSNIASSFTWLDSVRVQNVVVIVATLVALAGIVVNSWDQKDALQRQVDLEAEVAANNAWMSYRDVEERFKQVHSGEFNVPEMSDRELYLYHLTVERMMMSADIVTYSLANDKQWEGAFAIEFLKYRTFILSDKFLRESTGEISEFCTYRHPVHVWIERAFKADQQAIVRIQEAHRVCANHLDRQGYSDERGEPKDA